MRDARDTFNICMTVGKWQNPCGSRTDDSEVMLRCNRILPGSSSLACVPAACAYATLVAHLCSADMIQIWSFVRSFAASMLAALQVPCAPDQGFYRGSIVLRVDAFKPDASWMRLQAVQTVNPLAGISAQTSSEAVVRP